MREKHGAAAPLQACVQGGWKLRDGSGLIVECLVALAVHATRPARRQHAWMVALLLAMSTPEGAHAHQVDMAAVNAAATRGDAAALTALLPPRDVGHGWPYGDSALRLALESHCPDCVRALLNAGAPFPADDADALSLGYPSWFDLLAQNEPGTLRLFVRRGLRLRARGSRGDSLLHAAAAIGSADTVRWLARQKVALNARDEHGQTPLMVAAERGNLPAARVLLANGAALGLRDQTGRTAKQLAAQANHSDMVALLQSRGAREYVGTTLPAAFHDPGLAGRQQSDATGVFYERLPFLPAGLRFFAATLPPAVVHTSPLPPGWGTTTPAATPIYYLVKPPEDVVKLDHAGALAVPGLQLRSAADALRFVRVLTATEPYDPLLDPAVAGLGLTELPLTMRNNCLSFDTRLLRRIGARPPQAISVDAHTSRAFRIVRYMKSPGWPAFGQALAVPIVYRVVEQLDAGGRYAVQERRAIRTPLLVLRNVCGYR